LTAFAMNGPARLEVRVSAARVNCLRGRAHHDGAGVIGNESRDAFTPSAGILGSRIRVS